MSGSCSLHAGALAGTLSGPRVYFSMAEDHRWFAWLGVVHSRFSTPHRAILLQAAWASPRPHGHLPRAFTRVVHRGIFFALLAVGLMASRRRARQQRVNPEPAWRAGA
jgi:amino acid transporter